MFKGGFRNFGSFWRLFSLSLGALLAICFQAPLFSSFSISVALGIWFGSAEQFHVSLFLSLFLSLLLATDFNFLIVLCCLAF